MKIKRLLPLVLIAPLLASCGGNSVNYPKLESYSNKVEFSAFKEEMDKQNAVETGKCPFYNGGELPTFEGELKGESEEIKSIERSGKKIYESNSFSRHNAVLKYDATKSIVIQEDKQESSLTTKSDNSEETNEQKYDTKIQSQEAEIESEKHIVEINTSHGTYNVGDLIADTTIAKYAASQILTMTPYSVIPWYYYEDFSDEEKANSSFYIDGDILTFTFIEESDIPDYETDAEDKVLASAHIKTENKYQLTFKEDSLKVALIYNDDLTVNAIEKCKVSGKSLVKGDIYQENRHQGREFEIKTSQISLEALDLSTLVKA